MCCIRSNRNWHISCIRSGHCDPAMGPLATMGVWLRIYTSRAERRGDGNKVTEMRVSRGRTFCGTSSWSGWTTPSLSSSRSDSTISSSSSSGSGWGRACPGRPPPPPRRRRCRPWTSPAGANPTQKKWIRQASNLKIGAGGGEGTSDRHLGRGLGLGGCGGGGGEGGAEGGG